MGLNICIMHCAVLLKVCFISLSPTTTSAATFPSVRTQPSDNGHRDGPLLVSLPDEDVASM